ncbi:MAG TPA: UBP-type zinc finger domain-containing protein [Polyangiaceae bacterium]|nr:UBP-type zinc finger domain-containing protein [Polyangiaceae bacterium]
MRAPPICDHLETAARRSHGVTPSGHGCKECLESGGTWVHLRLCLSCGHVGCCDSSPGHHATKHFHATQHAVIRSYEPGETWLYCYPHDSFVDGVRPIGDEAAAQHYSP